MGVGADRRRADDAFKRYAVGLRLQQDRRRRTRRAITQQTGAHADRGEARREGMGSRPSDVVVEHHDVAGQQQTILKLFERPATQARLGTESDIAPI